MSPLCRRPRQSILYQQSAHVHQFVPPAGNGIRVDSGTQSGDEITIHYDPMIAKLIVQDQDRPSAINRMRHALRDMVILGTTTNRDFLLSLIDQPTFQNGDVYTRFVDEHLDELLSEPPQVDELALIVSALHDLHQQPKRTSSKGASDGDRFSSWDRTDGFRIR